MRSASILLLLCLVAFSTATVERMLDIALKILPTIIKDPKKQEMFRGALIAAKPCLEPTAQKAGEETVEKFLEIMFPMGAECGVANEGIEDLHQRRKAVTKCFHDKIDIFLKDKSQQDKDAFLETRKCFKEIFGDHE